jgi:DNA-binding CsgD family transcriptional regulator/PAS domain-containing protein
LIDIGGKPGRQKGEPVGTPRLNDRHLLDLVDLTYEAAADPNRWPACLSAVSRMMQGQGAVLLHHDLTSRGTISQSVGIADEALRLYASRYHAVDPWARADSARELARPGRAVPDHALVPRAGLARTEFHADFLTRFDLGRMVSLTLFRQAYHSGITIFRRDRDREFDGHEVQFLEAVIPHLQRALRIHMRLAEVNLERRALLDALDSLSCAVLVADGEGRVLVANGAAAALSPRLDGIGVEKGHLSSCRAEVGQRLRALCASAAQHARPSSRGGVLRVGRPDGGQLHVLVAPSRAASDVVLTSGPAALVFIANPDHDRSPSAPLLQRLFGLTPAESRIAAQLALGLDLEVIATARNLTLETVRWYNKQVLAKTGCRGRGELVRLLTRSLAELELEPGVRCDPLRAG